MDILIIICDFVLNVYLNYARVFTAHMYMYFLDEIKILIKNDQNFIDR